MGFPTPEEIELLGPSIFPFERHPIRLDEIIHPTEKILFEEDRGLYLAHENGYPANIKMLAEDELDILLNPNIKKNKFIDKVYLWVIDEHNGIRIIPESTRNEARVVPIGKPKYVCHTNITGGYKALQGGELYFCEELKLYINDWSGRYGNPTDQNWEAVQNHFRSVGYREIIDLTIFLATK